MSDKKTLIERIEVLEEMGHGNMEIRDILIDKLKESIENYDLKDPRNLKPTQIDSAMNMVKTIDDLMKSKETCSLSALKLRIQLQKDENDAANHSEIIAQFLQMLGNTAPKITTKPNNEDVEEGIMEAFENSDETINDAELDVAPIKGARTHD